MMTLISKEKKCKCESYQVKIWSEGAGFCERSDMDLVFFSSRRLDPNQLITDPLALVETAALYLNPVICSTQPANRFTPNIQPIAIVWKGSIIQPNLHTK